MLGTFQQASSRGGIPRPAKPLAASLLPAMSSLRAMWSAMREGLTACRDYEHLRSQGIAHDTAIRQALGLGLSASPATCKRIKPLYFAGKA